MPQNTENSTLGSRFRDAMGLAFDLHRLQERKGSTIPYVSHLMVVAAKGRLLPEIEFD